MALTLSDRGSLIVPVARETLPIPDEVTLDGERLVRKAEHHMTVLGYSVGKRVRQAIKARPELAATLQGLIDAADFTLRPTERCVHLLQPNLRTVVVLCDAPGVAAFFVALGEHLDAGAPPPPHVTLYTSDPEGKAGIGLNTVADLEAAIAREDPALLRARLLPASSLGIG